MWKWIGIGIIALVILAALGIGGTWLLVSRMKNLH